MFRFLFCLLPFVVNVAHAAGEQLRAFGPGTMERIVAERQGKAFVLALWSTGCTHCPAELKSLGALKRRHPGLEVVLVSTDAQDEAPRATALAAGYGLSAAPQWIFSDAVAPERLRFEIDRKWHGELPRTYLFDRNHRVEAVSGLVPAERLERWVKDNLR